MIGSGNQQALVDQGTNTLSSLFGNSTLNSLSGALGRFAGTGEGQAKSLLAMVAPIAMGVLGDQQKSQGLDAKGLTNLLTSQRTRSRARCRRALPSYWVAPDCSKVFRTASATQAPVRPGQRRRPRRRCKAPRARRPCSHPSGHRDARVIESVAVDHRRTRRAGSARILLVRHPRRRAVAEPETPPATRPAAAPETPAPAVEPAQDLKVGDVDLGERVRRSSTERKKRFKASPMPLRLKPRCPSLKRCGPMSTRS